jgi:hypothetical protein
MEAIVEQNISADECQRFVEDGVLLALQATSRKTRRRWLHTQEASTKASGKD